MMSLSQLGIILALLPAAFGLTAADLNTTTEGKVGHELDRQAAFIVIPELHELKSQSDHLASNGEEYYLCNVKGNWKYREDPRAYNNGSCFLMGKSRLVEKITTSKSFVLT